MADDAEQPPSERNAGPREDRSTWPPEWDTHGTTLAYAFGWRMNEALAFLWGKHDAHPAVSQLAEARELIAQHQRAALVAREQLEKASEEVAEARRRIAERTELVELLGEEAWRIQRAGLETWSAMLITDPFCYGEGRTLLGAVRCARKNRAAIDANTEKPSDG